jgi:hypothetical protein
VRQSINAVMMSSTVLPSRTVPWQKNVLGEQGLRIMPERHRFLKYLPVLNRPDSRKIYTAPHKFVRDFVDCCKINFALDCFSPSYRIFRYK